MPLAESSVWGLAGDLTAAAEAIRQLEMQIDLLKTALINKIPPRRAPTEGWSGEGPGGRAFLNALVLLLEFLNQHRKGGKA
jgi:hypothetical protein